MFCLFVCFYNGLKKHSTPPSLRSSERNIVTIVLVFLHLTAFVLSVKPLFREVLFTQTFQICYFWEITLTPIPRSSLFSPLEILLHWKLVLYNDCLLAGPPLCRCQYGKSLLWKIHCSFMCNLILNGRCTHSWYPLRWERCWIRWTNWQSVGQTVIQSQGG